jgi:uncharacterized protein
MSPQICELEQRMANDVLMVRIYLSVADHGRRKTLMREIFSLLHDRHAVRGVTVFRGVAGFGASGEVQANDLLRLTVDLPLVIELFDEPAVAEAAIHLIDDLVPGGHIVSWPADMSWRRLLAAEAGLSPLPALAKRLLVRTRTEMARVFGG